MSAHNVMIFENGMEQHAGRGGNLRQAPHRVYPIETQLGSYGYQLETNGAGGTTVPITPPVWRNPPPKNSSYMKSIEDNLTFFLPCLVGADLVGMYVSGQDFVEVATALDGGAGYALGAIAFYKLVLASYGQDVTWLALALAGFVPAIVPLLLGGDLQLLALMGLGGAVGAYAGHELVRSKYF